MCDEVSIQNWVVRCAGFTDTEIEFRLEWRDADRYEADEFLKEN
jgi:hypothetical protein